MAKLRTNCPACEKAIQVSDTAKKARCPGCKEIFEIDRNKLSAPDETDASSMETSTETKAVKADETNSVQTDETKSDVKTDSPSKSGKRSRAMSTKRSASRPAASSSGPKGVEPWMIVLGSSALLALILLIFFKWWAAIMIASAIGLYVDASLGRITRLSPSGSPMASAPMVWGIMGLLLIAGPALYALRRRRLLDLSTDDIAEGDDLTPEDLEEMGKVRAPSPLSPGLAVVAACVIAIGAIGQSTHWLNLQIGSGFTESRLVGYNPSGNYDPGDLYVHLFAFSKASPSHKTLQYQIIPLEGEDDTPVDKGTIEWDDEVASSPTNLTRWLWQVSVQQPGAYRLEVLREDGRKRLITQDFRIRQVR